MRRSGVFSLALVLCFAGAAAAQVPAPAARAPAPAAAASPLDNYATAAATTIIAEQACPGVQVRAGQLTTLRLAARVNAGQEAMLEEKLRRTNVTTRSYHISVQHRTTTTRSVGRVEVQMQ